MLQSLWQPCQSHLCLDGPRPDPALAIPNYCKACKCPNRKWPNDNWLKDMSTRSSWPRTWWTDHWTSNLLIEFLWFYYWKASIGISLLALGSLGTSILSLFDSNLKFWFGNRDQLSESAFLGAIPLSKHECQRRPSCTLWCCRFAYSLLFFNIPVASAGSFLGCFDNGNWLDCLKAALERRLVAQFL